MVPNWAVFILASAKVPDYREARPQCDETAPFAGELLKHQASEGHLQVSSVVCPACQRMVERGELESHYKACVDKSCVTGAQNRKCPLCPKLFTRLEVVVRHKRRQHLWGEFRDENSTHFSKYITSIHPSSC